MSNENEGQTQNVSIGEVHGDAVMGDQHKGDKVDGNKVGNQVNAEQIHGDVNQTHMGGVTAAVAAVNDLFAELEAVAQQPQSESRDDTFESRLDNAEHPVAGELPKLPTSIEIETPAGPETIEIEPVNDSTLVEPATLRAEFNVLVELQTPHDLASATSFASRLWTCCQRFGYACKPVAELALAGIKAAVSPPFPLNIVSAVLEAGVSMFDE